MIVQRNYIFIMMISKLFWLSIYVIEWYSNLTLVKRKMWRKNLNDVQYSFDIRYMTFFPWKYGRISFQIPWFPWHIYLRHPSLKHWRCILPCSIEMHVIGTLENLKKIFLTYKRKWIIYLENLDLNYQNYFYHY